MGKALKPTSKPAARATPMAAAVKKRAVQPKKKVMIVEDDLEEDEASDDDAMSDIQASASPSESANMKQWFSLAQASEAKESQKRANAIKRKISQYADEAYDELEKLNQRSATNMNTIEKKIARLRIEEPPIEDWNEVLAGLSASLHDINDLNEDYKDIIQLNGKPCTDLFQGFLTDLEANPTRLRKSRRKLAKKAQDDFQSNTDNQKLAYDAKDLIKKYKALLK